MREVFEREHREGKKVERIARYSRFAGLKKRATKGMAGQD